MQQRFVEVRVDLVRADEANPGAELVDLSVRIHARVGLADARLAKERRLASITSARVKFHRNNLARIIRDASEDKVDGRAPQEIATSTASASIAVGFASGCSRGIGRHGRDLPWRKTDDPYHILVSEIMLQQTQVDRVLPKYSEWLDKYPSLHALADAPEKDVTGTWYPLGYNIRPKRLQTIAREAVARYDGQLPSDEATLLSFKGIGAYTAGAIRSFAFRQRAAILDTNVARVLFRVFVEKGDPKGHAMKRQLWKISEMLVPVRHTFDFNQALMDLGAMVCTARNPKCLVCPDVEDVPVVSLHAGPAVVNTIVVTAAIIQRDGRYLVTRRQSWRAPRRRVGISRRQV